MMACSSRSVPSSSALHFLIQVSVSRRLSRLCAASNASFALSYSSSLNRAILHKGGRAHALLTSSCKQPALVDSRQSISALAGRLPLAQVGLGKLRCQFHCFTGILDGL